MLRGLAVLAAAASAAVFVASPGEHSIAHARGHTVINETARAKPNIVFVLTDDLSWDLIPFMPNVQAMQRDGVTFSNYFVTDSLCCPSRTSIFTGRYPHNHRVLSNTAPSGGFAAFNRGDQRHTFATVLQKAGYRTSMMGKFLNGYRPRGRYVPPGWSNWQVSGGAYGGFDYLLDVNGHNTRFGVNPHDYMTDVLSRRGRRFVSRTAKAKQPFFLEIATYAPHHPYTPAPRDSHAFPGLPAPRTAAFDTANENAPQWLRDRPPLAPEQTAQLDADFRKRAQSVLAVDDLVGRIRETLAARGLSKNTYVVFSSDNGYHMGDHRLTAGKMTAFDSDIRVPLIVVGPGVPAGRTVNELTENIDLAPTFERLAGSKPPETVDGHGLVALLHGQHPRPWRDAVLIEHHHPPTPEGDPDSQTQVSGNPPSYEAIRTEAGTYVEYVTGEHEYYDLVSDPDEIDNVYDLLSPDQLTTLENKLAALQSCYGYESCWTEAISP